MKINTQTIGAIIGLIIAMGIAYLDVRDRLTRMEAQLDILSPVAVDHMVAIELEKLEKPQSPLGSLQDLETLVQQVVMGCRLTTQQFLKKYSKICEKKNGKNMSKKLSIDSF